MMSTSGDVTVQMQTSKLGQLAGKLQEFGTLETVDRL